jgi:hypothetical protein
MQVSVIVVMSVALMLSATRVVSAADMPELPKVPQETVDRANKAPLIRYDRTIKGGAHTNGAWNTGSPIVLALAAAQGNKSADAKLLEQIRYSLKGENTITANGGYPAQHERQITGAVAIIRHAPRVWNQLTPDEQHKIDLMMTAALVGSAFTTSDANNPKGRKAIALDADTNLARGWNPNFREGMIGMMIVGTVYFGGGEQAQKVLDTFDHAAFVAELKKADLTNLYETFTWKEANPTSDAPDAKAIEAAIKDYRYMDVPLTDPMKIYYLLTMNTYDAKVNAGLNNGEGLSGAGKIAKGADKLPNVGKVGMLKEFASVDAGGPRSSIHYCIDGFKVNLANHVVLVAGGYWVPGKEADEIVSRLEVGIPDLYYKLENGYIDYSKGKASKNAFDITAPGRDFAIPKSLWEDVILPFHTKAKK